MQTTASRHRWIVAGLGGAGAYGIAAWTMAVSWSVRSPHWWEEVSPRTVGVVIIAAGLVLWVRLPRPHIGTLITLGGAVYYLQYLRAVDGWRFAVGFCLAYAWMAIAGHVLLSWPDGRLPGLVDRVYVVAAYVISIGTQTVRFVVDAPQPPWAPHLPQHTTAWGAIGSASGVVMGVAAVSLVLFRWSRASAARRLPSGRVWLGVGAVSSLKIAEAAATVLPGPDRLKIGLALAFPATVLALVPALSLIRWLRLRIGRLRVVGMMQELDADPGTPVGPATMESALRRTLGDPTLSVAYVRDDDTTIDTAGRYVDRPAPGPDRAVTEVHRRGRLVALIEHDVVLQEQRDVVAAAVVAAGLAIDNARLYAMTQAHLEHTLHSRLRLAQTAFDERQRIQRDLHDGAQQRFFAVLMRLDAARRLLAGPDKTAAVDAVTDAHRELTDALGALRDLIQGIYPAVLTDHGLAAAIEHLVDRIPLPVTVVVDPQRWTKYVEITAYFVVSEALTNVYRHAGATTAQVTIRDEAGALVVEVADDGRGGATVGRGSGLVGLHHRIVGVGGTFAVDSPPGCGTTVRAVFAHTGGGPA
ncbi:Histidine kinase [Micromonospora pallida]|uniref:histidine kinase n=1 Tax=Micromonospora pallida TaxID=145854 RepID=A0A1C6SFY1_9ACTN|nr:histidine kinase [Micromonospora pallida]SCL28347.1 Histidine kinase [Micromonospora pallida]